MLPQRETGQKKNQRKRRSPGPKKQKPKAPGDHTAETQGERARVAFPRNIKEQKNAGTKPLDGGGRGRRE